jgi:starch synthase (maltosyl-transferring)
VTCNWTPLDLGSAITARIYPPAAATPAPARKRPVYPTRLDGYVRRVTANPATGLEPARATPDRTRPAAQPPTRIEIQYPSPAVDGGLFPAKRCVGEVVTVEADVFRDGHDLLRAVVRYRGPNDDDYREA